MSDCLEALTVEKLNIAVSRAVNAAFVSHKQRMAANTIAGTISIPTTLPSSAPLLYSFNVNTQPPVVAMCKQPSALQIGTIIPVQRPAAAVVQLTPVSSQQAADNQLKAAVARHFPALLPKQPQNVPAVPLRGANPTRLTSIPVMTNFQNQPPQHAGTLILTGGRSTGVGSFVAQSNARVTGINQPLTAISPPVSNCIPDVKKNSTLFPPTVQKIQLLPLASQNVVENSVVERKTDTMAPVCASAVQQIAQQSATHCSSILSAAPVENALATKTGYCQGKSLVMTDPIGEETLKTAIQISNSLEQHVLESAPHQGFVDAPQSQMESASVAEESMKSGTFDASALAGEDVRTLVSMVKSNSDAQSSITDTAEQSDKENNIISAAFEMMEERERSSCSSNKKAVWDRSKTLPPMHEATRTATAEGFYCVMCNAMLQGPCEVHTEPMVHISDSPSLSYARASVPRVLKLRTSELNENKTGVFAKERIAKNTRFGPLIGESYSNEEFEKSSCSLEEFWLVFDNLGQCLHMLHTANEETSNWMRFVQRAPASAQQNVVAFQQGGDIYFITRCDVAPGAELLHWFSRDTAAFMGLDPTPEECLKCRTCQKQFTDEKSLKQHVRFKHPDMTTRKFRCDLCAKAFSSACKLNTHMQSHAGIRPHQCAICCKAFTDKSNLRMHLSIHTGERKFTCSICNKAFRQKAHLESHKLTHTKEKRAACRFCQKAFARQSDVKQHEFLHTKETIYRCSDPKCGKVFYTRQNLKKHERIHSGHKRFACEYCFKAFYTKYHVTRHESTCVGAKS